MYNHRVASALLAFVLGCSAEVDNPTRRTPATNRATQERIELNPSGLDSVREVARSTFDQTVLDVVDGSEVPALTSTHLEHIVAAGDRDFITINGRDAEDRHVAIYGTKTAYVQRHLRELAPRPADGFIVTDSGEGFIDLNMERFGLPYTVSVECLDSDSDVEACEQSARRVADSRALRRIPSEEAGAS